MLLLRVARSASFSSHRWPAGARKIASPFQAARLLSSSNTEAHPSPPTASMATTRGNSGSSPFRLPFSSSSKSWIQTSVLALSCLTVGFFAGQSYQNHHNITADNTRVLPNGLPRTCCERDKTKEDDELYSNLTGEQKDLPRKMRRLLGPDNVIDGRVETTQTLSYLKGARLGKGRAYLILTPDKLQQVVDAVELAIQADCVVLPQGQNTGLTGGSTPVNGQDTRPIIVISLKRFDRMFPLDDGDRVVCLAGTGLASLHEFLEREFPHRESHSVLGSTFLNPTTAAGVSLGSGGTQMRKGPAYTDRALYLTVSETKWGVRKLFVHNTLGIEGLHEDQDDDNEHVKYDPWRPRKIDTATSVVDRWSRWVQGSYDRTMRYSTRKGLALPAHDVTYKERLCSMATSPSSAEDDQSVADQISRFNADTRGSDPNRSEGKVIILATVHDTFPKPKETKTFWVSFDSLETALQFRRQVCLDNPQDLPMSLEYMDKDAYEVTDGAGRVLSNMILLVGTTSSILRYLWNFKLWVEALPFDNASLWVDTILYYANALNPPSLPRPVRNMANQFDHHAAMTAGDFGHGELTRLQERMQAFAVEQGPDKFQVYECQRKWEAQSLSAFRFAAAPAFRTYCVGKGYQGFSVDYALPKTKGQVPPLRAGSSDTKNGSNNIKKPIPLKRMRYSHFGCNVVHEDLAYAKGVDINQAKYALKHSVESIMGGRLPSEHGHGREYQAPPETQERWKRLDPLNVLNPGIGGLSFKFKYKE